MTFATTIWDELGLLAETEVAGQSWNPNGISTFMNGLRFDDYRHWDAMMWRTGLLDRSLGLRRDEFLQRLNMTIQADTYEERDAKARLMADHSDQKSLWFKVARDFGMRDHILLVFETTRTRSIEAVEHPDKYEIRRLYNSHSQSQQLSASQMLTAFGAMESSAIADIEAIIGRPYYEVSLGITGSETEADINLSSSVAADDIVAEAVQILNTLHVRPYIFWCSETELMIAAARPGNSGGPWNRAELERIAPLIVSDDSGDILNARTGSLREWSNQQRHAYEPGCDWATIRGDDAALLSFTDGLPPYKALLEDEAYTSDDRGLIKRLVRLGRWGYGHPVVRRAGYQNVHDPG